MFKLNVRGINADVDIGTEDVVTAAITLPAAAAATTVKSSDANDDGSPVGTGARTVRVNGIDTNYRFITEDAVMNGTTAVALTNQFLRVNSVEVLTVGSNGSPVGAITVLHTATVIGAVAAGQNRSKTAIFTPPSNWGIAEIKHLYGSITDATDSVVIFKLMTRRVASTSPWVERASFVCHGLQSPTNHYELGSPIQLEVSEDCKLTATAVADNTEVEGGFDVHVSTKPTH